jgi:hypothetical protein
VGAFSRRNGSGHGLHKDLAKQHRSLDNMPSPKDVVSLFTFFFFFLYDLSFVFWLTFVNSDFEF